MEKRNQNLAQNLKTEKIKQLRLHDPVFVDKKTSLFDSFVKMKALKAGCTLVRDNGEIVGIFSERDLIGVIVENKPLTIPISEVMTPNPKTLSADSTIAQVIRVMNEEGYRHLPLTETTAEGKTEIVKMVCVRDLVRYFGTYFAEQVYNLPPDPEQVPEAREGA